MYSVQYIVCRYISTHVHTLSRILSLTTIEPSFPHNFFMLSLWCPTLYNICMYYLYIYMYCTRTQVPNLTLSSWTLARVTLLSREIERERGRKKQIQANIMAAIMNLCMKTLGMIPIIPGNSTALHENISLYLFTKYQTV